MSGLNVKLIDFDTIEPCLNSNLPVLKDLPGTCQYRAPEAYMGHYSTSSDIYAVGVIMYALLTGDFPFPDAIFDAASEDCLAGDSRNKRIREDLTRYEINWRCTAFETDPAARDLAQRMLSVDKTARPTYRAALAHEWLAGPQHVPRRTTMQA